MLADGHALCDGPAGEDPAEAPPAADAPGSGHGCSTALSPQPRLFGATFEHIAGPTKPIVGVVRSKETGQPLQGVRVLGTEGATWTSVAARTDAQGRFRLVGLPKGEVYQLTANEGYGAIDPFLGARINVTDTEGLKPIEATIELPRGVVITGRLIDPATGRPVRAGQISYVKLPTNPHPGDGNRGPDEPDRSELPPDRPARRGVALRPGPRQGPPLHSRPPEEGGQGQGRRRLRETARPSRFMLNAHHAYKIIDVPADARSFHVDLELTRGLSRKGRVVDPDGKPVTAGAVLRPERHLGPDEDARRTTRSRPAAWSRTIPGS